MKTDETFQIEPKVGEGIYTVRDVSTILQLPYHKVSRWMREFWENYTFGIIGNKAINFYTLIEFYTFYHLRENGISAQKIKRVHSKIAVDLNTLYPFARKIHTDSKNIWYEHLENLIKADNKKQFDLKPLLMPFLNKVEFNTDEIANKYFPLNNSKRVVVDPTLQFGQPTITGTGIKAEIINGFYKGGESKESICKLYDLRIEQVEDAILYFKQSA